MSRFNKYFCVICDYHHHFQFYYPSTRLESHCVVIKESNCLFIHISHVLHTRCSVLMCACAGVHEHNHINVSVYVAFSKALRSQTVIYWEKWWKAVGRLFLLAVVAAAAASLSPPQLKLGYWDVLCDTEEAHAPWGNNSISIHSCIHVCFLNM